MALRNLRKIFSLTSNYNNINCMEMYFHKNRTYSIENKKSELSKCAMIQHKIASKDSGEWCKTKMNDAVCESKRKSSQKKKQRSQIWTALFGSNENKQPKKKCVPPDKPKPDPDLSMFGGQPYGTCGDAYVIKIDQIGDDSPPDIDRETELIKKIEAPLHVKNNMYDPMPSFRSAEQRLIDLCDRKLHPSYDKLKLLKKKPSAFPKLEKPDYKFFSGQLKHEEIPVQIKFNKELLEVKNMYSEFKRVEPPKQIIGRMIEIKKNERKYDDKPKVFFRDEQPRKDRNVFDSVFQDPQF